MRLRPRNKREYKNRITIAFGITLFVLLLSPFIPSNGALGTYNARTDTIWIDPDLEGEEREIVIYHEEAHRTFFQTVPLFVPFFLTLKLVSRTMVIFLIVLGLASWWYNKRILYMTTAFLFILFLPEIHAYGATLLKFGIHELTAPGFGFHLGMPIILTGLARFGKFEVKKLPRVIGVTRFRGKERTRAKLYALSLYLVFFAWGVLLGYFIFRGFSYYLFLPYATLWVVNMWIFKKLEKMKVGLAKKKYATQSKMRR